MIRLLVTSLGSTAAQNLVHVLRGEEDFFLVGTDVRDRHGGSGLCDRDEAVPPGSDPAYVSRLVDLVERHGIDLLVPVMEPELVACSREVVRLEEKGCAVLVSPEQTIRTCLSKRRTAAALREAGVPTDRFVSVEAARDATGFPLFIRPDGGTGSRGARAVRSSAELEVELRRHEGDLVISEYVAGDEFSVDGFCRRGGSLVHAIRRSRDETRGGLAFDSTVVPLAPFRGLVEESSRALELFGFFNLQIHLDEEGEPRVFDVNPRLGGGMILSFAAGLDAAAYLRCIHRGEAPEIGGVERLGMRLLRRWHDVIVQDGETCREF